MIQVLFNFLVFSLLSFVTTFLLLQVCLTILKIISPKIRCLCYVVPLGKLCVDLFRFNYPIWVVTQQINPLLVAKGSRVLQVFFSPFSLNNGIGFYVNPGFSFTIADVFYFLYPRCCIFLLFTCLSISVVYFLVSLFQIYKGFLQLRHKVRGKVFDHSILHSCLQRKIQQRNIRIIQYGKHTPCSFWLKQSFIVLPTQLALAEVNQIVAHEIKHIEQKDFLKKIAWKLIGSLFWWLPIRYLANKWNVEREKLCDQYALFFASSKLAYINLLKRFAEQELFVCSFSKEKELIVRAKTILKPKPKQLIQILQVGMFCFIAGLVFLGKYWMF